MIIPEYWAEARRQYRGANRQVTVRRFGWSNDSQAAAQAHADARASEALEQALRNPSTARRELKVPYNGGEGLPIREEVIQRSERYVITRNSYGALCLNTPDVMFADIDLSPPSSSVQWVVVGISIMALMMRGWLNGSILFSAAMSLVIVVIAIIRDQWARRRAARVDLHAQSLPEIEQAASQFEGWSMRLYRTPAGYRLLVTDRCFDPGDEQVAKFFRLFGVDPMYALMCRNQNCFRARLTAKPWRMGMHEHMRPRPGVWPVAAESLATRSQWIEQYQSQAIDYAACEFVKSLGGDEVADQVQPVLDVHDSLTQCHSGRPLA